MRSEFRRNTVSLHIFMLTTFSCICLVVAATLPYAPAESLLVSMTSANGWPQIVWWLILPRLTSYGVRQANHHPIHHFHQPALPYNRRPAFVISVCCSTAICLSRFTSTSLLLAATVLFAVSRVVDVHSVVVHQLLWLTVSLSQRWTIATAFSLAATSNSLTNFNVYTELRSSSDLWRRPSRARNSTATW